MEPLHPAPAEGVVDHRDTANREQFNNRSTEQMIYKRVVEQLAEELQIHPADAHAILMDGAAEVTRGLAWDWWFR